jgi:putative two-component system response regulator
MGIEIARSHHEKWNGTGYPDGLAGYEIPLSARVMTVADCYDALRSKRCYKDTYSHEESRELIVHSCGNQFDPDVIRAFNVVENEFRIVRENVT